MNNGERRGRGTGWVTEQNHKTMFTNHSIKKKRKRKKKKTRSRIEPEAVCQVQSQPNALTARPTQSIPGTEHVLHALRTTAHFSDIHGVVSTENEATAA